MTRPEPKLGSPEQTLEAVRESNDAPQGGEHDPRDVKAEAAVKASNDRQYEEEKEGKP